VPLPLPNLDARRWRDLIDEGRALIPRHSRRWTDHNVHDPGITFMELFAAWAERCLYAANRIPTRHVLKYLGLAGFAPREARAAVAALVFDLKAGEPPTPIPAGLLVDTDNGDRVIPYRLQTSLVAGHYSIAAIQSFDGRRYTNCLRAAQQGTAFPAFGDDPRPDGATDDESPAFYLGFADALAVGDDITLFFATGLDDGTEEDARETLRTWRDQRRARCAPDADCPNVVDSLCEPCPSADSGDPPSPPAPSNGAPSTPPHHDVTVVWEMFDASGWRQLDHDEVADETRALTLDGLVVIRPKTNSLAREVGETRGDLHYLRCRRTHGMWDAAPTLVRVLVNAARAIQEEPLAETLMILPGAAIPAGLAVGSGQHLQWSLDPQGRILTIAAATPDPTTPELRVFDVQAPTAVSEGRIGFNLRGLRTEPGRHGLIQRGDGLPEQVAFCPESPLSPTSLIPWLLGPAGWESWRLRRDLDAALPTDAAIATDNAHTCFEFGDGMRGRVMPDGATAWLSGSDTHGAAGAIVPGAQGRLRNDALNSLVLGADIGAFAGRFTAIHSPAGSSPGRDPETIDQALARTLDSLWVHERLNDASADAHGETLDGLDPAFIRGLPIPERAATVADFERIALAVPGTRVRRARAWADCDGRMEGLQAPGAVTVMIVPALPAARPQPSAGLVHAVRDFVESRRTLCTRVVVMGPTYVMIGVHARVKAAIGADPGRVAVTVRARLERFLDPLQGGPRGRGWPFGRDVYRSEILQVIDDAPGVDHVESLELTRNGCLLACSNACVSRISLAASGEHAIEVIR
jgi:hypothetical protein